MEYLYTRQIFYSTLGIVISIIMGYAAAMIGYDLRARNSEGANVKHEQR